MKPPTKKEIEAAVKKTPPFARFTMRTDGGLILGVSHRLFKPGRIYEIREILGEYIIKELGPSCLQEDINDSPLAITWNHDVNHILSTGGGYHLFTKKEYAKACRLDRKESA